MGAACLGLAALGCRPSPEAKVEAAREAVLHFFTALPAGDCQVLAPLLVEGGKCSSMVQEFQEHGVALVEVLDGQVDGRDPDAVMLRARVRKDGQVREQPLLLRVERHGGEWKLRF